MPERPEFERVAVVLSFWVLSCGAFRRSPKRQSLNNAPYPEVPERKGAGTREWFRRRMERRDQWRKRREEESQKGGMARRVARGWKWVIGEEGWELKEREKWDEVTADPGLAGTDERGETVGESVSISNATESMIVEKLVGGAEQESTGRPTSPKNTEDSDEKNAITRLPEADNIRIEDYNNGASEIVNFHLSTFAGKSSISLPVSLLRLDTHLSQKPSSSTCRSSSVSCSLPPSTRPSTAPDLPPPPPKALRPSTASGYGPEPKWSRPDTSKHQLHPPCLIGPSSSTDHIKHSRPRHYHRNQALTHARAAPKRVRSLFTRTDENPHHSLRLFKSHSPNPHMSSPRDKFKQLRQQHKTRKLQKRHQTRHEIGRDHPWYSEIILTPHRFSSASRSSMQWSAVGSSPRVRPMSRYLGSQGSLETIGSVSWLNNIGNDECSWPYFLGSGLSVDPASMSSPLGVTPTPGPSLDLSRCSFSLESSNESFAQPPPPYLPSFSLLHPSPQRCVWAAHEMGWMVTPIPTVAERNVIMREIWKRKQLAGCWVGGEDWGMWRAENFLDIWRESKEDNAKSRETDDAEGETNLDEELVNIWQPALTGGMAGEGKKTDIPTETKSAPLFGPRRFSDSIQSSPTATEVSEKWEIEQNQGPSNLSPLYSGTSRPRTRRIFSSGATKPPKLTLDLPDMEPPRPDRTDPIRSVAVSALGQIDGNVNENDENDEYDDDSLCNSCWYGYDGLGNETDVTDRSTAPRILKKYYELRGGHKCGFCDDGMFAMNECEEDDDIEGWVEWIHKVEELMCSEANTTWGEKKKKKEKKEMVA